ncbi:exonuclease domain-containing protein [Thalassotalea sp. 1_MG-2023]|uniref:exonuclease domain-containing protein n=1 Tax=Thalassotalea sp. 1_MG-2023 TaxID=3062680 RepID=UPI0026E27613|nr:exonuclease domain-containing protein [Thalassotalea sp. 1_MG-2023]MDO6426019.1 exonuclease domain-containing protein [Thalassotalea sp. 1_MG-2023]
MWRHQFLFNWFFGLEIARKKAYLSAPAGPLKDYLSVPFPALHTPLSQLNLIALDFETTGLNAVKDKLLTVGHVEINNQQILLGSGYHQIINTQRELLADNVAIHQITDQQQQQGKPLAQVVKHLLKTLAGKPVLVHFSRIEKQFLQRACLELYGIAPPLPIIDTLLLAKKRLDKRDVAYDPSELRLSALRQHYQLPRYQAHNALSDAIATAELFLVESQHHYANATLKDLLS